MHRSRIMIFSAALLLLLTVQALAQDDSAEISVVGYWSTISDWEGEPEGLEWDSDFQYGADGSIWFGDIYLNGRWMIGDFDNGIGDIVSTWSLNNLELVGGYTLFDSPFSVLVAYKHWELEQDEINNPAVNTIPGSLVFSFDGLGVGAGLNWDVPDNNFFVSGQAIYYFEMDSSLDVIDERGFDMGLTFNGEVGMLFENGFMAAVGARFEQVHQDLPEEERVAPFIDYGFEQFSITARIGYRFGM